MSNYIPYTSGPSINPVIGCTAYSRGCTNCWARAWAQRFRKGDFSLTYHPEKLDIIRRKKSGLWFVGSMTDLFQDGIDIRFVDAVFAAMCDSAARFLVLTKRAKNLKQYANDNALPGNVGIGVTAEGQTEWDERVPILMSIKAKMHFVSIEPILEAMNIVLQRPSPDWIQCGPETGRGKRECNPDWIHTVARDCRKLGIKCFDKRDPSHPDFICREWPERWTPRGCVRSVNRPARPRVGIA